jgi:hypothetical protein
MRTPWRRATDPRQSGFLIEDDANVLAVADVLSVTMAWLPRPSLYRPARRGASFVREGFDRPAPVGCLQPCRDEWDVCNLVEMIGYATESAKKEAAYRSQSGNAREDGQKRGRRRPTSVFPPTQIASGTAPGAVCLLQYARRPATA